MVLYRCYRTPPNQFIFNNRQNKKKDTECNYRMFVKKLCVNKVLSSPIQHWYKIHGQQLPISRYVVSSISASILKTQH